MKPGGRGGALLVWMLEGWCRGLMISSSLKKKQNKTKKNLYSVFSAKHANSLYFYVCVLGHVSKYCLEKDDPNQETIWPNTHTHAQKQKTKTKQKQNKTKQQQQQIIH